MQNEINIIYGYTMTHDTGFAPNPFFEACTLACCKPKLRKSIYSVIKNDFIGKCKIKLNLTRMNSKRIEKEFGFDVNNLTPKVIKEHCNQVTGYEDFSDYVKNLGIWIMGFSGANFNSVVSHNSEIYAMQICDLSTFEDYWNNQKYQNKKTDEASIGFFTRNDINFEQENKRIVNCGDNIYSNSNEEKTTPLYSFHYNSKDQAVTTAKHDLSGEYVLFSNNYIYFGSKADIIDGFKLKIARGHSVFTANNSQDLFNISKKWLNNNFDDHLKQQVIGRPINSHIDFEKLI